MKMKSAKRIVNIILVCSLVIALSACGGGMEKKILGRWAPAGEDEYITFYSSGIVDMEGEEGTWSIEGDNLSISQGGVTMTAKISRIASDCMTWEVNGNSIELIKYSD